MVDFFEFELYWAGIHLRDGFCYLFAEVECFGSGSALEVHEETVCVSVYHLRAPSFHGVNQSDGLLERLPSCLDNAVCYLRAGHAAREGGRRIPVRDVGD